MGLGELPTPLLLALAQPREACSHLLCMCTAVIAAGACLCPCTRPWLSYNPCPQDAFALYEVSNGRPLSTLAYALLKKHHGEVGMTTCHVFDRHKRCVMQAHTCYDSH